MSECAGKQSLEKSRADMIARAMGRRGRSKLRVYYCADCRAWHIGRILGKRSRGYSHA